MTLQGDSTRRPSRPTLQRDTPLRQRTAAALFVAAFEVYFEVYGASMSGTGLMEVGVRRLLLTD